MHSAPNDRHSTVGNHAHMIEHDLEEHLRSSHGHHLYKFVHDEVHTLRKLDSRNGKLNGHQFSADLKALNRDLEKKGLLPDLHIVTDGKHRGELIREGSHHQADKHGHENGREHPQKHPHEHPHENGQKPPQEHGHESGHEHAHEHRHKSGHEHAHEHARTGHSDVSETHLSGHRRGNAAQEAAGADNFHHVGRGRVHNGGHTAPAGIGADSAEPMPPQPQGRHGTGEPGALTQADSTPTGLTAPADGAANTTLRSDGTTNLSTLRSAIERAKDGGRPLNIVQIGDSHIKPGVETQALANRLAADSGLQAGQVQFSFAGEDGKTASYANQHPSEFLRNINQSTDLVVVSFGSNEAGGQAGRRYASDYAQLISQIRQRAPQSSIVMVGPTDGNYWNTGRHLAGLDSVAAAQASVAARVPSSAYLDVRQQMGSVASMRASGIMRGDNLHLTPRGYTVLGSIIADDIARSL